MAEIQKTNVCCLDLTQECVDYIKSLDLNVYEGSLGSVFSINWGHNIYRGTKPVLVDINIPVNLHEYHVFIHDMENPHVKGYKNAEHHIKEINNGESRLIECRYPVNTLDLRPFGTYRLASRFEEISGERRIEILFVGSEMVVDFYSNVINGNDSRNIGEISNIENWHLVSGKEKLGQRVKLEDNNLSKRLFDGRLNNTKYHRVFYLPTKVVDEKHVTDAHFVSLLSNESGECVSYVYYYSDDYVKIVLPQVEDKVGLLKELFENCLFKMFSNYFPDVEARNWIYSEAYLLPDEKEIEHRIENKRKEYEKAIADLEEQAKTIREEKGHLKRLLTESGSTLVTAVKSLLEWLGFENVIDKDDTLKGDELKEEDLCFEYEGNHIYMEVKGINGTSTDAECSQVDKVVNRRMRELKTTDVHGVYVVNHQKNIEPLKRQTPPFNETQIKDAENQSRTLVYTVQLFSLYFDIENGYITKEQARKALLKPGLAQFHSHMHSLGVPYSYYKDDTIICLDLHDVQICVGDTLYFEDALQRLVGRKVVSIEQEKNSFDKAENGETGIMLDGKIPRNREIFK